MALYIVSITMRLSLLIGPKEVVKCTTPSANTGFSGSTLKNPSGKNSFGIDLTSSFSKNDREVSAPVVAKKTAPIRAENPFLTLYRTLRLSRKSMKDDGNVWILQNSGVAH